MTGPVPQSSVPVGKTEDGGEGREFEDSSALNIPHIDLYFFIQTLLMEISNLNNCILLSVA